MTIADERIAIARRRYLDGEIDIYEFEDRVWLALQGVPLDGVRDRVESIASHPWLIPGPPLPVELLEADLERRMNHKQEAQDVQAAG
jgi:hypothetical protein